MTHHASAFRALVALLAWLSVPVAALAQQPALEPGGRKGGTYFKLGLAHWQGDIFSESTLTHWNVDLFGAKYDLTSVKAEIDTYFPRTLLISGLSIGYRKDAVRRTDSGHMFSAMLFRDIDLKVVALKAGGGVEWGLPSMNFDRTEFDYATDGTVRYRHTYPDRNAYVPFVGTKSDGAVYPFLSFSVVQRPGGLLFEAGMRVNLIDFRFDDYEIAPADQVRHGFTQRRVRLPYLFANLGVRLF
jgi:hypothetical protein